MILQPLRFRAPGAMKIKRTAFLAGGSWSDLEIDQGVDYIFAPCDGSHFSYYETGEWYFKRDAPSFSARRVLHDDVARIHAELCDLMNAEPICPKSRTVCEVCGGTDRVDTGPWSESQVMADCGVTDAALCFNCANYVAVGTIGPLVKAARMPTPSAAQLETIRLKKVAQTRFASLADELD